MSAQEPPAPPRQAEQHGEPVEQRSKVKITRNAKGDPQWEVSVVDGVDPAEMARIRTLAVEQHKALVDELVGSAAA